MAIRDGIITKETLNLIMLLDNSGSMEGERINQLNKAIPVLKEKLIEIADNEMVDIKVRVISFSEFPNWEIGSEREGVDIHSLSWKDIGTIGWTNTELAIREANKSLKKEYMGSHALHPVVILVTDGGCTGPHTEYLNEIEKMRNCLSGANSSEKVTRVAIGVKDYNRSELEEFASTGIIKDSPQPLVFGVEKAEDLCKVINWATVTSMYSSITNNDTDIINLGEPNWSEEDDNDDIT